MLKLKISSRSCLTEMEVEALRGKAAQRADYLHLIDEDAMVFEVPSGDVIARLVPNCLPPKVVSEATRLFRGVRRDASNRGNIVHKDAMMNRERTDGSLGFTKAVPPSMLRLLADQNSRLGLTGPYTDALGYFDKMPRQSSCRPTAWSLDRPDIFAISRPLVKEVERVYKHELPQSWQQQHEFMRHVSRKFKYEGSVFSTVTVNLNVRCRYHTDDGDFRGGMGNLVVLELADDRSGILVMPRERVAFIVRPTDVLLMNVHHMHGNLPLTSGGTRLTSVFYSRERIAECRE